MNPKTKVFDLTKRTQQPRRQSKRYEIATQKLDNGFSAAVSLPGKTTEHLFDPDGDIALYNGRWQALGAAGLHLCDILNSQTRSTMKHGYERIGGAEIAAALTELDMTPTELAIHYGTDLRRVMKWIHGEEDAPVPLALLLRLLTLPGVREVAQEHTDSVTWDKRDG
ncbi:hypothetical protein [Roseibium sp. Sym1]|uniref:hypothetical protein n=1 Tax=Roseibium sp. Sym1 TaxID=3016006 RepID=UPI0022B42B7A|nr:hypothetical protein [Roseibium sp. Sym1]